MKGEVPKAQSLGLPCKIRTRNAKNVRKVYICYVGQDSNPGDVIVQLDEQ